MPAPRMTQNTIWKHGDYFKWKDNLRLLLPGYELPPTGLSIRFHIPMPKSWSKKKRASLVGTIHQQTPDLDNFIKAFKDSFGRDEHVAEYEKMGKYWAEEGAIEIINYENKNQTPGDDNDLAF